MAEKRESKYAQDVGINVIERRLRERQSVRTTFRLPVDLIEVLGLLAGQFGVKQKSLFDQLVEDGELLDEVADHAASLRLPEAVQRRAKTYVLSKRSLQALQQAAKARRIPRDTLVEVSIRRLLPLLLAERERHRKRMAFQVELEDLQRRGRELLAESEKRLGAADPVTEMLAEMVRVGEEKLLVFGQMVARGSALEELELERLAKVDSVRGKR